MAQEVPTWHKRCHVAPEVPAWHKRCLRGTRGAYVAQDWVPGWLQTVHEAHGGRGHDDADGDADAHGVHWRRVARQRQQRRTAARTARHQRPTLLVARHATERAEDTAERVAEATADHAQRQHRVHLHLRGRTVWGEHQHNTASGTSQTYATRHDARDDARRPNSKTPRAKEHSNNASRAANARPPAQGSRWWTRAAATR